MTIRVLLVDDHKVVVDGLRELLESEEDITVVAHASDGRQAVAMAAELSPTVVVMDVTMPELNGVDATKQILQADANTRVLALSMHASNQIVSDMLRAGASGYVVKTAPVEEVLRAIRSLAEGKSYLSPDVTAEVLQAGMARQSGQQDAAKALSAREREVLQQVAEGKNTKEIAFLLEVTVKTVEWHRRSIMEKLSIRSIAELTKYAVREGLTPLDT